MNKSKSMQVKLRKDTVWAIRKDFPSLTLNEAVTIYRGVFQKVVKNAKTKK